MKSGQKTLSVALTGDTHIRFAKLAENPNQEQLALFYWRPSAGVRRFSAIVDEVIPLPTPDELIETGNVSFRAEYLMRVLAAAPEGAGIGMVHSHPFAGWQGLSRDDAETEGLHLAPPVCASRGLPLLGMTIGTDGTLSARFWEKESGGFVKRDVASVRVVG